MGKVSMLVDLGQHSQCGG